MTSYLEDEPAPPALPPLLPSVLLLPLPRLLPLEAPGVVRPDALCPGVLFLPPPGLLPREALGVVRPAALPCGPVELGELPLVFAEPAALPLPGAVMRVWPPVGLFCAPVPLNVPPAPAAGFV